MHDFCTAVVAALCTGTPRHTRATTPTATICTIRRDKIFSIRATFERLKAHTADDLLRAGHDCRTAAAVHMRGSACSVCGHPAAALIDRNEIPPSLRSSQRTWMACTYWECESCIPVSSFRPPAQAPMRAAPAGRLTFPGDRRSEITRPKE